jgi:predicted AlkP superfamily pyrophosphatase or phosphodiesterase
VRDYVLPDLRPDVFINWMGPLDSAQHAFGVGSPQAKDALRHIDGSLAKTLATIDSLDASVSLDVVVTSDHGFARHTDSVNLVQALIGAGLKANVDSTDIIVAGQGQGALFYVRHRDSRRVERLVRFLQAQPWVDVVFTRGRNQEQGHVEGTFSLDLVHGWHPTRAPDVAVSLRWTSETNDFGVAGTATIVGSTTGAIAGGASGHGGLSPWVVRNTLLVWGPSFKARSRMEAPASLADVMPTVLTILDINVPACRTGCGRVLREALVTGPSAEAIATSRRVVRTAAGPYRASLEISTAGNRHYVDSGARER